MRFVLEGPAEAEGGEGGEHEEGDNGAEAGSLDGEVG